MIKQTGLIVTDLRDYFGLDYKHLNKYLHKLKAKKFLKLNEKKVKGAKGPALKSYCATEFFTGKKLDLTKEEIIQCAALKR